MLIGVIIGFFVGVGAVGVITLATVTRSIKQASTMPDTKNHHTIIDSKDK